MQVYELKTRSGIESLQQVERDPPQPGPGQVLLRMRAVSLNYRDLLVVQGLLYPQAPSPLIPVSDGVGEVVTVGEGVTRVKAGDRVACIFDQDWLMGGLPVTSRSLGGDTNGVLAHYVVLGQEGVVPVPAHLSDEEAATLPCAAVTAWNALMSADALRPGQTVLVQGTGGVSLFALQFARLAGARVIVISSSDAKLERAAALGADGLINYKQQPDWDKAVLALTDGRGVDCVVEVGGERTLAQSLNAVCSDGRVAMIGLLSGLEAQIPIAPLLRKQVRVRGVYVGSRQMFEQMNKAIEWHGLRPVVDRVFEFGQAQEAMHYLRESGHVGKVCLRF